MKEVPTINVKAIERALKIDADAQRLVAGKFIDADPEFEGPIACESAGRCSIGALLFHAGASAKTVNGLDLGTVSLKSPKVTRVLKENYGLLPIHTEAIIQTNDSTADPQNNGVRLDAVMGLVTFASVMQEQGVRFKSEGDLLGSYEDGFEDEDVVEDSWDNIESF